MEISYLPKEMQEVLVDCISMEACTPSHYQAIRMRTMYNEGTLTEQKMLEIMQELKPNQNDKVNISKAKLQRYIPQGIPLNKQEDYIIQALKHYERHLKRQKDYER